MCVCVCVCFCVCVRVCVRLCVCAGCMAGIEAFCESQWRSNWLLLYLRRQEDNQDDPSPGRRNAHKTWLPPSREHQLPLALGLRLPSPPLNDKPRPHHLVLFTAVCCTVSTSKESSRSNQSFSNQSKYESQLERRPSSWYQLHFANLGLPKRTLPIADCSAPRFFNVREHTLWALLSPPSLLLPGVN